MNEFVNSASAVIWGIPLMLVSIAIFAVLERIFPAVEHKSLSGWGFNLATMVLYLMGIVVAGGVAALVNEKLKAGSYGGLIDLRIGSTDSVVGSIAATLLFLLIFDFFYYWWHRSQHKLPALWAIHKLHHMDEGINVTTNQRHHWLEDIARIPAIVVPMTILFNLSPQAGGVVGFVVSSWTYFFHSNLRLSLGRLSWVINAPQVHRIHHSRLPDHFDRNFAAFFPIWDIIFGSYYPPRRGEFPPTGVAGEPDVSNPFKAALLPFRSWRDALPVRPWRARAVRK